MKYSAWHPVISVSQNSQQIATVTFFCEPFSPDYETQRGYFRDKRVKDRFFQIQDLKWACLETRFNKLKPHLEATGKLYHFFCLDVFKSIYTSNSITN